MKKIAVLVLVLFSFSVFASELDGRSFNTPESIIKLINGTQKFEELKFPTCIAYNINASDSLPTYYKVGYFLSSLTTKKVDFTASTGEVLPAIRADIVLKHATLGDEVTHSFHCLTK